MAMTALRMHSTDRMQKDGCLPSRDNASVFPLLRVNRPSISR